MQVTPEMTTEGGSRLDKMADFLDADEVGVQAILSNTGHVKLTVDSTAWPSKSAYLDADDADALGDLLKARASELRARS